MLWHRLNETGPRGVVAKLSAQGADALGQRFVSHRNAAPDLFEEAVLGDQPPLLTDQQGEGDEVAGIKIDRRSVAAQLPVGGVEDEAVEMEAFQNILRRCS